MVLVVGSVSESVKRGQNEIEFYSKGIPKAVIWTELVAEEGDGEEGN